MSTNKHEIHSAQPGITQATNSRFCFRNHLSQTVAGQMQPVEPTPIWMGDWRLAIAEERVAIAEERLARALERFARANDISY